MKDQWRFWLKLSVVLAVFGAFGHGVLLINTQDQALSHHGIPAAPEVAKLREDTLRQMRATPAASLSRSLDGI